MAEARSIATLGPSGVRRTRVSYSDEGLHVNFSITIPSWLSAKRWMHRRVRRLQNYLTNTLWPFGPLMVFAVMLALVGIVVYSDERSWWRAGFIASFVWNVSLYFPWFPNTPRMVRIGVLAANTGFFFFVLLAMLRRYLLRSLLHYQGWLYLPHGKPKPLYVKAFFAAVSILKGRKPMTYSHQNSMPRLPVPSLKGTIDRYLETVRPLQDDEQFEETKKLAKEFASGVGWKCNALLTLKSWFYGNYVTDWWERYIYLIGRDPIMINSNYYILDSARWRPTNSQIARASVAIEGLAMYGEELDAERIEPLAVAGIIPMCMDQHRRVMATTRIPGRECDVLEHWDHNDSQHCAVFCRGSWYKLPMYHRGRRLTRYEISVQLTKLKADAISKEHELEEEEANIACLTAGNRTEWAAVREGYLEDGINYRSLHMIESAQFVVILDSHAPDLHNWSEKAQLAIAGSGGDRWFDKSVSTIFYENGHWTVNAEHSWADAPAAGHAIEWAIITGEKTLDPYDEKGELRRQPGDDQLGDEVLFRRATWALPRPAKKAIAAALTSARALINDLDLRVVSFGEYGKGFNKLCKVSPDAFVQMALQLAYYRQRKAFSLTYESSMTRLFHQGRTETVRPCSVESCAFVKAMLDPNATDEQRRQCLHDAVERHQTAYRDCMTGKGVDRHLFALLVASKILRVSSPFLEQAVLQNKWRLSTSQQPQQQLPKRWSLKHDAERISPGGGFGPVADDGYGVSYMVLEHEYFFHVSSKKSSPETSTEKFIECVFQSLRDMRALFPECAKKYSEIRSKLKA